MPLNEHVWGPLCITIDNGPLFGMSIPFVKDRPYWIWTLQLPSSGHCLWSTTNWIYLYLGLCITFTTDEINPLCILYYDSWTSITLFIGGVKPADNLVVESRISSWYTVYNNGQLCIHIMSQPVNFLLNVRQHRSGCSVPIPSRNMEHKRTSHLQMRTAP